MNQFLINNFIISLSFILHNYLSFIITSLHCFVLLTLINSNALSILLAMSFHGFHLFFLFRLLNINLIHFFVLLLILIIHKRVELISHFHFLKELFHCLILQVYLGDLNYLIFLDYRFLIEVFLLSSLFKYPIVIFNNHLFHFIFTVLINSYSYF